MIIVLNRLVGRKKIVRFVMIPSRITSAPSTVRIQPSADRPLKNSTPTPMSSGISEIPNAL
jgi:hypothetical protein